MIMDHALDAALERIRAEASRIDICAAEPKSYAGATGDNSIGHVTAFTVSPVAPCTNGRKCVVSQTDTGQVIRAGTPGWWAISGNGQLLAYDRIKNGRSLVPGLSFKLPPLELEMERQIR